MNRKIKLIIFVVLILLLISIMIYSTFGISVSYESVDNIKQNRKVSFDLLDNIIINNSSTIYDKDANTYYYNIPLEYKDNYYVLKLELEDGYKYKLVDYKTNIIKVNYSKPIKIIIYNDKEYYESKIVLTNLALVNIEIDDEITKDDTKATIKYINNSNENKELYENAMIRLRGSSSINFDKKSYKIKFYNSDYSDTKNVNIDNFYYDDTFILDSLYRDSSKIRNSLAFNIWDNISLDFTSNNIYMEYVEVFINGKYNGLYSLEEAVNRKNLGLDKTSDNDTSAVIKSVSWDTVNDSKSFEKITSNTIFGYELNYPNDSKYYSKVWYSFLNNIYEYYNTDNITYDMVDEAFDLKNYVDIVIFNSFIDNSDCLLIRNMYFYMPNLSGKVYLEPWDMEFSFGIVHSNKNLFQVVGSDNLSNELFTGDPKLDKLIVKRYRTLRKTILTEEYFNIQLNNYLNILNNGATLRDSDKWYEYDVELEINNIRTWIKERIKFMDSYVDEVSDEL